MPPVGPIARKFFGEHVIERSAPHRRSRPSGKPSHIRRISTEGFLGKIDQKIVLPVDPEVQLTGKPDSGLIEAGGHDAAERKGSLHLVTSSQTARFRSPKFARPTTDSKAAAAAPLRRGC
jgi:hypothetical protein